MGAYRWAMPAILRLIHPAPAGAVIAVSAALTGILLLQARLPVDARAVLIVASVAASQVATGAINDWVDRDRDRRAGRRKPIPGGAVSPRTALVLGIAGLVVQLVTSALLGPITLLLAVVVSISAQAYNLALSRTPLSVVPYLVSFGLLPAWIASAIDVPLHRIATASLLVMPFAAAAHLTNALLDFESDAAEGSRNVVQVLGRRRSRIVAAALAVGVGIGVGVGFAIASRLQPIGIVLGALGIVAVAQGVRDERRLWYGMLAAAVLWTVAWAVSTA